MLSKQDCLALLTDISNSGIECSDEINRLMRLQNPDEAILKFINDNRDLDICAFYEKLRKSYNNKKSKLYINIVKEIESPEEVLSTLSAMLTQIVLFSKTCSNKIMFMKNARAKEITAVLDNYFRTYDITYAIKLLKLIKADIKIFEELQEETAN